jgi:hypothetical protein
MKIISNDQFEDTFTLSNYATFIELIVNNGNGFVNTKHSYAILNSDGKKIAFQEFIESKTITHIRLIRKKEIEQMKSENPKQDYSWWTGDNLYYEQVPIFPGGVVTIFVKGFLKNLRVVPDHLSEGNSFQNTF